MPKGVKEVKLRIATIFFLALSVAFIPAIAQTQSAGVNTAGLSAEQVTTLNRLVEQLRQQPANTLANLSLQTATPDKVREWTEAGTAAGKAVGAFTKEIGIAADQFLKTDVGRTAFYVAVWKFGGDKVVESFLQAFLSIAIGLALLVIWWKFTRRFAFNERKEGSIVYNENTFWRWLGFNKKEVKYVKDEDWIEKLSAGEKFWALFLLRVFSVVLLAIIIGTCWPKISF